MQRVFLDANVLFSAAYRQGAGLQRLWKLRGVELMTSDYAVQEAYTNLTDPAQHQRLAEFLKATTLMPHTWESTKLPEDIVLPQKDVPILQAAIQARAEVLLTGDGAHFGRYYRRTIAGVRVLPPGEYLLETRSQG